jgi:hydrogenase maturation protease
VSDALVIGYGNEMRGDDGLGPYVAKSVSTEDFPGVRVLTARQLLPEFAADLAQAKVVVFVDASVESSENGVSVRFLAVEDMMGWSTHHADPRALLALAQTIYGRTPEAWWLTVVGRHFEFGEGLSEVAVRNARQAIRRLKSLLRAKTQRRSSFPRK